MNLQNVKKKLDKVNRFFAYLESNQEQTSRIDRDSLLYSIRSLYDACFDEIEDVNASAKPVVKEIKEKKHTEKARNKGTKLVFTNTSSDGGDSKKVNEVNKKSENPDLVEAITELENKISDTPKKSNPVPKEKKEVELKEAVKAQSTAFNVDYEELFMFKAAADLSQKLSETPLKNLNKALGLNEKFLYINELFAGDVAKFQASVKILNEGKSFALARSHIESDLIEQFGWMKKQKKNLAIDFLKLVRRRYL
jgi:hypothetical protein